MLPFCPRENPSRGRSAPPAWPARARSAPAHGRNPPARGTQSTEARASTALPSPPPRTEGAARCEPATSPNYYIVAPQLGNSFWPFFRRRRRQIAAGADYGGAPPTHVLAPPRPPMMRAHQPALPLAIRAVP